MLGLGGVLVVEAAVASQSWLAKACKVFSLSLSLLCVVAYWPEPHTLHIEKRWWEVGSTIKAL